MPRPQRLTRSSRTNVQQRSTQQASVDTFFCNVCQKSFTSEQYLRQHELRDSKHRILSTQGHTDTHSVLATVADNDLPQQEDDFIMSTDPIGEVATPAGVHVHQQIFQFTNLPVALFGNVPTESLPPMAHHPTDHENDVESTLKKHRASSEQPSPSCNDAYVESTLDDDPLEFATLQSTQGDHGNTCNFPGVFSQLEFYNKEYGVFYIPLSVVDASRTRVLTSAQEMSLDLHDILDKAGASLSMFDKIMKWAAKYSSLGAFDIRGGIKKTRRAFVKEMIKMFRPVSPRSETIELEVPVVYSTRKLKNLPSDLTIPNTCLVNFWNFGDQVDDLVSAIHIFGDLDNLNVDLVNPYSPFPHDVTHGFSSVSTDEVQYFKWYSDTLEMYKSQYDFDERDDFLLPIIFTGDRTGTTGNQRFTGEPILITTSVIKREVRNHHFSWRPLGLVPEVERYSVHNKKRLEDADPKKPGRNLQNYHKVLDVIFRSYLDYQRITNVRKSEFDYQRYGKILPFGGLFCRRRVFTPFAFFVGDAQTADKLTARKQHSGSFNFNRYLLDPGNVFPRYNCDLSDGGLGDEFFSKVLSGEYPSFLPEEEVVLTKDKKISNRSSGKTVRPSGRRPVEDVPERYFSEDEENDADDEESAEAATAADKEKKRKRKNYLILCHMCIMVESVEDATAILSSLRCLNWKEKKTIARCC